MILFFTLIVLGDFLLKHVRAIPLKAEVSRTLPAILVDRNQNIFYRDYWGHKVTKMDRNGSVLFTLGAGPGQGPGELYKPKWLGFSLGENIIYVMDSSGKIQTFDMLTGKYLKVLARIPGYTLTPRRDGFLILGNGQGRRFIHLMNNLGKIEKNWYPNIGYDPGKVTASKFKAAWHGGITYYAEGAFPEIWMIKDGADSHQVWELTPPRHYRKPPKKPMDPAWRFDGKKVESYYNSFTKVWNLGLLENRFLAVCWDIRTPFFGSLDLYSLEDKQRTRILANVPLPGLLACTNGSFLYVWEEKIAGNEDEDDQHILHIYKLVKS